MPISDKDQRRVDKIRAFDRVSLDYIYIDPGDRVLGDGGEDDFRFLLKVIDLLDEALVELTAQRLGEIFDEGMGSV